jgi:hypothetical protein
MKTKTPRPSAPTPATAAPPAPATAAPPAPVVTPPAAPLPPGEFAAFIGLDWGDETHAVAWCARDGARVETLELADTPEALHGWFDQLAVRFQRQPVAVAVEASKGAIVAALREHAWLVLYPVHPATSRRFSQAFTPSGAADDTPDALVLLSVLRHHRDRLRAACPEDDATSQLGLLNEHRRKLVDHRTLLGNQLTSTLKQYFPQALELTGTHIYAPLALALLQRWPELAQLQRARPETVRGFFHEHQVRRPELIDARLARIATARPLTTDRGYCETLVKYALALVAQLRCLNTQIEKADAALAEAFAAHPEAAHFKQLPGAGPAMAPRLCVLFGSDRARWTCAAEMQKYLGIAPVIEKSGRQRWVHWRWHAPAFARQTLVEWAGLSVLFCDWAKAYYQYQKERGKKRSAILRALAFKWLRVLWRCWQNREAYDDARYLAQLKLHAPAYLAHLPAPPAKETAEPEKKPE